MRRQVITEHLVQAGLDALKATMYMRMPGAVVAYRANDTPTPTVDVQPMVNDVRFDVDTGAIVFEPWNVIYNVPVCWPRFGGVVIAGFLAPGDPVLIEAFDLDPTPWRAQGRSTNPVNPADVRRLGGNYWSCTPTDLTGPIGDSDVAGGASFVLGFAGGTTIVFNGTTLTLGKLATQVTIAGGLPAQGCARMGDLVAGGMFAITSASTKTFVG